MALNLKTLATRSMSAVVFVVLLVGCVYWNYISFSLFFFAVSMIGLHEFYKIAEKMGAKPIRIIGYTIAILTYLGFMSFDNFTSLNYALILNNARGIIVSSMILGPFLIFAIALFRRKENAIQSVMYTIGGIIYAVLPFALLNQTVFYNEECNNCEGINGVFFAPKLILGIIFLIWSNDTFAYLGGGLFGKNKMIERVSPGKTWEGTIIGVLITFGLSFSFDHIFNLGGYIWPMLGIIVPVLATIGDLVESKLKREAAIKDSGSIMPGHGGILDRFDSLIFVSPFVFVFFKLI